MNERNDQQAAAAPGTELESWKRGTKACAEVLGQVVRQMQDGPKGGSEAMEAAMFRWIRDNCEVEHQNWQYMPDDPMVVPLAERVDAAMKAQASDAEVGHG